MRNFLASFLALFFLCLTLTGTAQKGDPDPRPFGQQLWYGGNFILGFSGSNGVNAFQLGISPMVGYKFTPIISAGPRLSAVYNNFRVRDPFNGNVDKFNTFTWSAGMFGRVKVLRTIFGQVEYAYESEAFYDFGTNDVFRRNRGNVYVGAGYNSGGGGGFASEIAVLYNTSVASNSLETPWDIRFGFTYNF